MSWWSIVLGPHGADTVTKIVRDGVDITDRVESITVSSGANDQTVVQVVELADLVRIHAEEEA